MRRFLVNCISITGLNVQQFMYGEHVNEKQLVADNIDKLLSEGAIIPHPDEINMPAADPAKTEDILANLPDDFKQFLNTHSIEEIKAEFGKEPEEFPEAEWKNIVDHEELVKYIASKMAAANMKAEDTIQGQENQEDHGAEKSADGQPAAEGSETTAVDTSAAEAANALGVDLKAALGVTEKVEGKTYGEWTVPTLKERLTELKLEFDPAALKKDLYDLLKANAQG